MLEVFVLNPPGRTKRHIASSKLKSWQKLVSKYGVTGAKKFRARRHRGTASSSSGGSSPRRSVMARLRSRRRTRRNAWPGQPRRHAKAARKGWRNRRRRTGPRKSATRRHRRVGRPRKVSSHRKRRSDYGRKRGPRGFPKTMKGFSASEKRAYMEHGSSAFDQNPRRRRRRRSMRRNPIMTYNPRRRRKTRRNDWKGQPIRHSRAAKKGWRRRRRKNGRRSYRRNPIMTFNPRRRRRSRRRNPVMMYNARRGRRYSRNPIGTLKSTFRDIFTVQTLEHAAWGTLGAYSALGTPALVKMVLPAGMKAQVDRWNTGLPGVVMSVVSTGLITSLAGMIPQTRRGAKSIFVGGMIASFVRLGGVLFPQFPIQISAQPIRLPGISGLMGLGDTADQVANNVTSYMGDFKTGHEEMGRLGDYATGHEEMNMGVGAWQTGHEEMGQDAMDIAAGDEVSP